MQIVYLFDLYSQCPSILAKIVIKFEWLCQCIITELYEQVSRDLLCIQFMILTHPMACQLFQLSRNWIQQGFMRPVIGSNNQREPCYESEFPFDVCGQNLEPIIIPITATNWSKLGRVQLLVRQLLLRIHESQRDHYMRNTIGNWYRSFPNERDFRLRYPIHLLIDKLLCYVHG